MVVGFPGGGAPDLVARLTGQWLADSLGQPFIIENRPGAASNIATDFVVRSPPDGYTLQMTVLTNVFNTTLYTNLNFVFADDITHIAGIANAPYVIIVPPSLPVKTVPEFVAYAKANPGKINMASGGRGSSSHIFGELFKAMAGIDVVHVPYRVDYMPDLLSGQVQMAINPIPQALALIRDGKLTVLAVTTKKRLATLPDIPTAAEAVPGYEASAGRARRAQGHARRYRRDPQRRDQQDPGRSEVQGTLGRHGHRADADGARAVRGVHWQRNRQVDPGDQVRRGDAGVRSAAPR